MAFLDAPGPSDTAWLSTQSFGLAPLVDGGRIVTFDQRGTGASGPIACPAFARGPDPVTAAAACAASLGPARTAYTTAERVADADAVRSAIGVERMAVYGVGRGARLALAYASAYPDRVMRLVLDSPLPSAGVDPFQRATIASLRRWLRTPCTWDCPRSARPDAEFASLVRDVGRAPLAARAFDGRGRSHPVAIGTDELLRLLLAIEENGYAAGFLPTAVHAARQGDPALLARLVDMQPSPSDWRGMDAPLLAERCQDDGLPWAPGTPPDGRRAALDARGAGIPAFAFAPFTVDVVRGLGLADVCIGWPESPIAQPALPAPASVPTLILAGRYDRRTPLAGAVALHVPGCTCRRGASVRPVRRGVCPCAPAGRSRLCAGRCTTRCSRLTNVSRRRPTYASTGCVSAACAAATSTSLSGGGCATTPMSRA
ncbi:MAG: alpha/beta fold hydrolase [Conexibacter sp.]